MPTLTTDAPPAPQLDSHLLGPIALAPDALLEFPAGLFAFERFRRFALVPAGRDGLAWLQSAEEPGLVFLLADPFHWFPGYDLELPHADVAQLGLTAPEAMAVFVVVTLPTAEGERASANLRAPVIVNVAARTGRQLVLADDRYRVQTPFAIE